MTIDQFMLSATSRLTAAGIDTARLDCLVLMEDALGLNRAAILAHPEHKITNSYLLDLNNKVEQRVGHKPLAYIRQMAPFYGREFKVSRAVLVPRPETEDLIDLLKNLPLPRKPMLADIGTGSGCIGITAALEIKNASLYLCDIDQAALQIAKHNAKQHAVQAELVISDLCAGLKGHFDVVMANLPYVPTEHPLNQAAKHEPELAIFGGQDGLDIYGRFWEQIKALKPQWVITESLPFQHKDMAAMARKSGYALTRTAGLAQQFNLLA